MNVKSLAGLISLLIALIRIAYRCQSSVSDQDLATLGKYSYILPSCTLFLRFADNLSGQLSQPLAVELWQSLSILKLFHTSAVLLFEQLSDGKCKMALQHLEIIPAGANSTFNLQGIAKKYKLSVGRTTINVPIGWNPMLSVGDFWEIFFCMNKTADI